MTRDERKQIRELLDMANRKGDLELADLCRQALAGNEDAQMTVFEIVTSEGA